MTQAYQIWSPGHGDVSIEYSTELLRQVHREGSGEKRGVLYGRRRGSQIRLLAARRTGHSRDLCLIGLERVGVFAVRSGGDVFLTEEDLEFAEWNGTGIAMVLAAGRGGFFVREADGSILAIRSHQEFAIPDFNPRPKGRSSLATLLNAAALAICMGLSVAVALYAEPKAALKLSLHEEAGQLVAVWSPGVRGTIEIRDGERRLEVAVAVFQTQTTYLPDDRDVNVVLTTLDGVTREDHLRILGLRAKKTSPIPPLLEAIETLNTERDDLLQEFSANRTTVTRLEQTVKRGGPEGPRTTAKSSF